MEQGPCQIGQKSSVSRANLALNPTNKGVMQIKWLRIRNVHMQRPKTARKSRRHLWELAQIEDSVNLSDDVVYNMK